MLSAPRLCLFSALVLLSPSLFGQDGGAYRLRAGDQIRLSVFQEAELGTEVALTAGGEVSFPLVGSVQLLDMTLREAEEAVTKLYNADYLVEPRISINLLSAAAERVTVIGAVIKPGEVSIPANMTLDLVSALDWAGGVAPNADRSRIEVKRGEVTTNYDLRDLRAKGADQVPLQNGDRINVPASPFANQTVTLMGEIRSPGTIDFPINGKLDLEMAIGLAGGLTGIADSNRITVKRNGQSYGATLAGGHSQLAPGDIVTIPPNLFVGKTVMVTGLVGNAGPVPFPSDGKLDILSAVAAAGDFARLANKKKVTVTRRGEGGDQSWKFDLTDMAEGKAKLFYLVPGDTVWVPERRF